MPVHKFIYCLGYCGKEAVMTQDIGAVKAKRQHPIQVAQGAFLAVVAVDQHKVEAAAGNAGRLLQRGG